ncbi:ACP S-malonyltransferase [Xenorhabdus bovienii]|uniref:ACP S-malonyltransferase n=1 Tax=Xenorhabdus bovienii TaxID=40576 RepID=UPI0023B240F7|nr:ACP S-malonyltransferase [Xenorhabdus bovienii]MDE9458941.1 ACP S-malonyltransferase [Xenorhabdus bovienii]MDE9515124.1 ACP S-malonyltransferase [Xenorhabdus bovienii]
MIGFLFPGQGSQRRGMGEELFDEVPEYSILEPQIDAIVGYSMRRLCQEDTNNKLRETQFTQPCLYVTNALHYYKTIREGRSPRYLAGHSLGEYNALLAAGAFDFMTGLRLVKKRGELMSQAKNGGMAAILGLPASLIKQVLKDGELNSIDIANFNSPSQTVISGSLDDIQQSIPLLERAGAKTCLPLPVSKAFHSHYVADTATEFADFLAPLSFMAPKIPVISNVTASLYPIDNASESIKSLLVRQITHSVNWMQSIQFLINKGVTQFHEIGPGHVLTKLVQQIQQQQTTEELLNIA